MWVEKHRPETLSEIVGNEESIREVHEWAKQSNTKPLIIHGPAGVGKTTVAHCIGNMMDWSITEVNASDKRARSEVESVIGEQSKTRSLFGETRRLIIVDEADNFHGNFDRGGMKAIREILDTTEQPIILIANDLYELPRSVRNNYKTVEFNHLDASDIFQRLKQIAEDEGLSFDDQSLQQIAKQSNGDVRGAINDLQKYATENTVKTPDATTTRDQDIDPFEFMDMVFKDSSPRTVRSAYQNVDMTPFDLYWWIEDNVSKEYTGSELRESIALLDHASYYLHYVNETNKYRFWKYISDFLTAGIASSRTGYHRGWTRWSYPSYNNRHNTDLYTKLQTHESLDTVQSEIYPYLQTMIEYCKPEETTAKIAARYDLTRDEIAKITGSGKQTNKMDRVLNQKQEIQNTYTNE